MLTPSNVEFANDSFTTSRTMRVFICLVLAFNFVFPLPLDESSDLDGWYVPQVGGSFEWVSRKDGENLMRRLHLERSSHTEVKFFLYTRSNAHNGQIIDMNNITSALVSGFRKDLPTRIIIHGWQNNHLSPVNVVIRKALLATGEFNVISVDWSSIAETINYPVAASKVSAVGKQVATFIELLHSNCGLQFDTLHLLGHSLGAHVSGFAGKFLKIGQIRTIIGMDVALPYFTYTPDSERLSDTDAYYVESIHTCGGLLGFAKPIGKAAFYINGGKSQPGCGVDVSGSCAHQRSYLYYAEAIMKNNFPSMKCATYKAAMSMSCDNTYSSIRMGSLTNDKSASGHYYVPVNKRSPYGKMSF